MTQCNLFWGSHGCDLPVDDGHTVHECDSDADIHCSQFLEETGQIRHWSEDEWIEGWGEWKDYGPGFR